MRGHWKITKKEGPSAGAIETKEIRRLTSGTKCPIIRERRLRTWQQRSHTRLWNGKSRPSLLGSQDRRELCLSSALQPIAIAYFIAVLVVYKSWRFQATFGSFILAGYALLLAYVPAPGIPAGTYMLNHNLVHSVDLALLGQAHWDRWPYAPEGWGTVLSTIPTVSTTILGLLIGELLMSCRSKESKIKVIGMTGVLCLALGYALSRFVPVIMKMWSYGKMWTSSYGLLSAGWACLIFMLFYWIIDGRGYWKWSLPIVVIGANAIFIYMFASLIPISDWVHVFTREMTGELARLEPLVRAISVLVIEWLILFWMYRRKILIKA